MSPTSKAILRILRKQPATAKQLAEITGKTRQYVGQEIAQIRGKPGKIHVSGWQGALSKEEAIYSVGRGQDVPKPPTAQEIVLSPFAGIGSEGHVSLQMQRKFIGVELKTSYYQQAAANLKNALRGTIDLFSEAA